MRALRGCLLPLLAAAALAQPAGAQDARVSRIVVPAPAGGSFDAHARHLAQRMAALTGETFIVENRPGANTNIGVEHVIRSAPDGRTILLAGANIVVNPAMYRLPFSPQTELAPLIHVSNEPYVLAASATLEPVAVSGLRALAERRPGGLSCAGTPGPAILGCEQLKERLGGAVTPAPYPGVAPILSAVAGGHVDVAFLPAAGALALAETGKVRILAVSREGVPRIPAGTPLILAVWPGMQAEGLVGLLVPAATPEPVVARLNRQLQQVLREPETEARLREAGQTPGGGPPEQFAKVLRDYGTGWSEIIRRLGLTSKQAAP